MIAVDTNILVRYAMRDDSQQLEIAHRFLHENECFVLRSVVLEFVWVLSSAYNLSRQDIVERVRHALRVPTVTTEDVKNVTLALEWYEKGMDFADALHLAVSIRETNGFSTFDKKFANVAKRLGVKQEIYFLR